MTKQFPSGTFPVVVDGVEHVISYAEAKQLIEQAAEVALHFAMDNSADLMGQVMYLHSMFDKAGLLPEAEEEAE